MNRIRAQKQNKNAKMRSLRFSVGTYQICKA